MSDWATIAANIAGTRLVRHAVLTYAGTWAAPGVGYASDVVNGLNQFVSDELAYEVPVIYPASMGPVNGPVSAPSYDQSIQDALDWTAGWLAANPNQTFALGGYSQGAEAASRVVIELMGGSLAQYLPNFIGGYTLGNPSRGAGFHAAAIADPGGRGISSTRMTQLPTIGGTTIWADFVHSKNNGDSADDLYSVVPNNDVGLLMSDVYDGVTAFQFNDLTALAQAFVKDLIKDVQDLLASTPPTSWTPQQQKNVHAWENLLNDAMGAISGLNPAAMALLLPDLWTVLTTTDWTAQPTGLGAAFDAAILGIEFLAAPGGPTAPHTSYEGTPGYSNLLAPAVGFLEQIARLTPARA